MTESYVLSFAQNAITVTLMIAGPVLLVSLIIGSVVSMFQAATQINEASLSFIPKLLGMVLVVFVLGSWMGQQILAYTTNIFTNLPYLPR